MDPSNRSERGYVNPFDPIFWPNPFTAPPQALPQEPPKKGEVPAPLPPRNPFSDPPSLLNPTPFAQRLLERKLNDPSVKLKPDESIAVLSECIRQGEKETQKAVGKDLIIFIGNTQSGKSTLVNYLYGCEMEGKTPKELGITSLAGKLIVVKSTSRLKEIMPIGHSKKSMTFMPNIETDQQGFTYCDCPGFLDNRGSEINTANAVNIKKAFTKAKSVRVVILINYHSLLTDRARGLSEMFRICADLFGSQENFLRYKDSILLGITQLPALLPDLVGAELIELKTWVKETHLTDPFHVNVLRVMSERLFIYDPLNRTNLTYHGAWTRETLLKNLTSLPPIQEPLHIFKTVLNAEDERALRLICDEMKERIQGVFNRHSLSENDYLTTADYLSTLYKLEIVENPYVSKLIGEARTLIIDHFSKKLARFEVCCADSSLRLEAEAKVILEEIKQGVSCFDGSIQKEVNCPALEERLDALGKKKDASTFALELQDLEKKFRDSCLNSNFVQAKLLLDTIQKMALHFDKEYGETNTRHGVNTEELDVLFQRAKKKYDDSIKKEEIHNEQLSQFEEQRKTYLKTVEKQRKRASALETETDKQIELTRKTEKARLKLEKVYEEQKQRAAEMQAEHEREMEAIREEQRKKALELQALEDRKREMLEAKQARLAKYYQEIITPNSLTKACQSKVDAEDRVRIMIERGAKPDSQTLTWAFFSGKFEIIYAVIQAGAMPDGETLNAACSTQQVILIKIALMMGARASQKTMEIAKKGGIPEIIDLVNLAKARQPAAAAPSRQPLGPRPIFKGLTLKGLQGVKKK